MPRLDHVSVAGSQSSAAYTAPFGSLKRFELLPPVASTLPSGNTVAFRNRRACAMELV